MINDEPLEVTGHKCRLAPIKIQFCQANCFPSLAV